MRRLLAIGVLLGLLFLVIAAATTSWMSDLADAGGHMVFEIDDHVVQVNMPSPGNALLLGLALAVAIMLVFIAILLAMALALLAATLGVLAVLAAIIAALVVSLAPIWLLGMLIWYLLRKPKPVPAVGATKLAPDYPPGNTQEFSGANIAG
jgi:hypothetical protein